MTYKPEKGSRQPVVLYDQDNKAIDVSGIEELSSVKIDTGKIAGDLKLVKDNQGRLYGQYGETWIPVKVDSEGRPIVNDIASLKADIALMKTAMTDGNQKVQLSGTTMELYGVTIADRPPADTVLAGATFTIVDESGYFQTWISDGTKWVEV
jgi:hypothetical protein